MRAAVHATLAGLALAGVATIAHAQVLAPLCPPGQVGMPCNSNKYDLCLPTLCWQATSRLNQAGRCVLVPSSCTECTACVQADCRAVGCPYGGVCTYLGTQQSPCGGFGYGPTDQTVVSNPTYSCVTGTDGGSAGGGASMDQPQPTCPDVTGWDDMCGPQPSGWSSSGGPGAGSGSGGLDASAGIPPGASSSGSASGSGSGSSPPADSMGGGSSGVCPDSGSSNSGSSGVGAGGSASGSGSGSGWSSPAADVDATTSGGSSGSTAPDAGGGSAPPPRYVLLSHGACAIASGAGTAGSGEGWSVALALGLLFARRKATAAG